MNKLQKPVKLLKEQFVIPYYCLRPAEGVTIYAQVILVLDGFPA